MSFRINVGADFRLASRARYFQISFLVIVCVLIAALLSAYFGGRQPVTVALDVGISVIRLLLPLVLVLLVQDLVFREFDRRYFLNSLAYPKSRLLFFIKRFSVVISLLFFLLFCLASVLALVVSFIGQSSPQLSPVSLGVKYWIVVGFMAAEIILLASLACFLAVVASVSSFVLVGAFGFMLVARSYSAIFDLLARDASLVVAGEEYRSGVGLLGYLLPDLGAMDVRMIALYGDFRFLPADWYWLLLANFAYALVLLGLTLYAFQRKRFS